MEEVCQKKGHGDLSVEDQEMGSAVVTRKGLEVTRVLPIRRKAQAGVAYERFNGPNVRREDRKLPARRTEPYKRPRKGF